MKKNYVIQVAPLVRLPILRTQVFSYLHEKPLSAGTLVDIPFYRRNLQGIVVSSKEDFPRQGAIQLKKINSVIQEKFLSERQIELAKKLASHYLSPIGIFLKLMTSKGILNIKDKKEKIRKLTNKNKLPKSKEAEIILKSQSKNFLVIGPADKRLNLNLSLVSNIIKSKKQCLVLVPEIFQSHEMQKKFQGYFPREEIALFHGKILKGQFYDSWQKVKERKINVVIATKVGVFLPFSNLGLVIVEEEQDISHKQWDMSPRYGAVRAAEVLAKMQNAKIVFGSASPSIETCWRAEKEKWQVLNLREDAKKKRETEIIDLYQERKNPDFPISKRLYESISRALNERKKILLLVKRRGYSTFSVCRNCKNILKCPKCERALVYFDETDNYRCLHCSYRADIFSSCPKCGSHQFSHFGVGIQLVERKIRRLFPKAKAARLDLDSVKTIKKYKELGRKMKDGKIDIIIGTQTALKLGGFFDFDLVGVVSAHEYFPIADFNSTEQALSSFIQAKNLVKSGGKFVIQTFFPKEQIFDYLESKSQEDFFEREIKLRKKLFCPPFSRLVKLSYRDDAKKKVERETKKIFDLLKKTGNNEVEITDPYDPLAAKKRGYFYKNILIKVSRDKELKKLPLYPIIGGLKKGWGIDVEPVNTV